MYHLTQDELKYLTLLSRNYKDINEASSEIINLQAILNLPKGTEHFVSDIHGEYESFNHVLKNASGVIKNYIEELFGQSLMENEKKNLATLIYYPTRKLSIVKQKINYMDEWYKVNLFRLIRVCKRVSSKYTRSKVRKALPTEFAYILEELIHEDSDRIHKQDYYNQIIDSIIRLERADNFIVAISEVIQILAIDHLHVIGDIYDRGNDADKILDLLQAYHSVDVQWGNHDISWMCAASGGEASICNVIRISARYDNLHTIEEGYGINLVPLATFAMEFYENSDCERFKPENYENSSLNEKEIDLIAKMHKAITIMQFKLEAKIIMSHPEYRMEDRLLLDKINLKDKTVIIDGKIYSLCDSDFPTLNEQNPFELSHEEQEVIEKIRFSFLHSTKLQQHTKFLFNKGSMYNIYNGNLLFHGCIPLLDNGELKEVNLFGYELKGKKLLDRIDTMVRKGYFSPEDSLDRKNGQDLMWYLWCGSDSPLYGKDKMTTFERYFTEAHDLYEEKKDPYYTFRDNEDICINILKNFDLCDKNSRIVNGHVPVKVSKGESPVKANGKLLVIDGGFAKAYQNVTGIAGYTLIYNSQGLLMASHEPFVSMRDAIENETDIVSSTFYIEHKTNRIKVADTDIGKKISNTIRDLETLVKAYKTGVLKEQK